MLAIDHKILDVKDIVARRRNIERFVILCIAILVIIFGVKIFNNLKLATDNTLVIERMGSLRVAGLLAIQSDGNYPPTDLFCGDQIHDKMMALNSLISSTKKSAYCESSPDTWVVYAPLLKPIVRGAKTYDGYCVDSTGNLEPIQWNIEKNQVIENGLCKLQQ